MAAWPPQVCKEVCIRGREAAEEGVGGTAPPELYHAQLYFKCTRACCNPTRWHWACTRAPRCELLTARIGDIPAHPMLPRRNSDGPTRLHLPGTAAVLAATAKADRAQLSTLLPTPRVIRSAVSRPQARVLPVAVAGGMPVVSARAIFGLGGSYKRGSVPGRQDRDRARCVANAPRPGIGEAGSMQLSLQAGVRCFQSLVICQPRRASFLASLDSDATSRAMEHGASS
jgi:hypothetical protein